MYTYTVKGDYTDDDLKVIQITLDHPQGHRLNFEYVNEQYVNEQNTVTVTVIFLNEEATDRFCGMKGMSCYTSYDKKYDTPVIVFNIKNWNNTPKAFYDDYLATLFNGETSINATNYIRLLYKIYVINHEFGHFLGYNHDKRVAGKPCSVMVQQTLGIQPALPNVFVHSKKV